MSRILNLGLALGVLAALAAPAGAQNYPTRTVKFIVPFGAGGPADVYARVLAQHLTDELKASFIVENRPGAGSIIGSDAVAKSPPDGYTLLVMSNTHTTNESLIPNKPFQLMRDFVPVTPINYSDVMMVVHPSVPAKDLKEFIALAKAKPGALNYASSGPGTPYHMAGELFKAMSGTNIVHVPHKSSGDMRSSVLGGHVQGLAEQHATPRQLVGDPAQYDRTGHAEQSASVVRTYSLIVPGLLQAPEYARRLITMQASLHHGLFGEPNDALAAWVERMHAIHDC